ncbi:MAG TPA: hypothetical protein VGO91_18115 [Pyrinomonadaceae bacterium]|jgi:hypothetical protein|nr:hypothetical protein [Pyrinomonadaceae bacterium]
MPKTKNQAKNKSRFEVRGGVINEFEFALNEGAMTEEEHQRFLRQEDERRTGEDATQAAPPHTEAERIQQLMSDVHEKVTRKKQKQSGQIAANKSQATAANKSRAGSAAKAGNASAKKGGAGSKSAGAKKAGVKKAAAKSGAKKGAAKKASARKGAARKSVRAR